MKVIITAIKTALKPVLTQAERNEKFWKETSYPRLGVDQQLGNIIYFTKYGEGIKLVNQTAEGRNGCSTVAPGIFRDNWTMGYYAEVSEDVKVNVTFSN